MDLTPEELRSKAHRSRFRIPDAKFLVLVASAAVVLVVVGFAVTGNFKSHTPSANKTTSTTTSTVSAARGGVVPNLVGLTQSAAANCVENGGSDRPPR